MTEYFQVGAVTQTHGIRGEVKVFPTTDDSSRFNDLKQVILDTGKEKLELEVEQVKFFKQFVILKFKGIDNINDVEKYKGSTLWVSRENAVKLNKDEYFVADLIGLKVFTEDKEALGGITDVLKTGANDVYVVSKEGEEELLIPAIKECIKKIDLENGMVEVHLLEGLRDLNKKGD